MSFAAPLMWLGLVALLPLIAIYFLKVRPTRKPATAWFLWAKVLEERRARTLFERFRDLFSLLLLVIVFLAAVAAAARPYWVGDSRKDLLLLLIDNSASMNAVENGTTRLDLAKQAANEIVQALDGNQKCSVAAVATEVVFYSNLTDNPRELLEAIERIPATALPSSSQSLASFVRDAKAVVTNDGKTETATSATQPPLLRRLLISDGCLGASPGTDGLEWIQVGGNGNGNLGIVACDMQRLPLANWPVGVYLQVTSSFKETITVDLGVYHDSDENLKKLIPLEIKPGLNSPEVFRIEDAAEGRWFFRLEQTDGLVSDNEAYAYLPALVPVDVGVLGDDRFFYDQSVQAFSTGERWLRLVPLADATVVIGQGAVALTETSDSASMLIFNPTGESPYWLDLRDPFAVALATVADEDHPLVKHWEPTSMAWVGAKRLKAPPGSEILVTSEDGTPLLYRVSDRGRKVVVANFDPTEADFFLSPWFPVMVYSVATHLSGQGEPKPTTIAVGRHLAEFFVDDGSAIRWTLPSGEVVEKHVEDVGIVRDLGFHQWNLGTQTWIAGCSLLDATESSLQTSPLPENAEPLTRSWSPGFWLTLVAILIVVSESMLYHRRWVG